MADEWLQSVEKRIEQLENRVFGDESKDAHYPPCIDSLGKLNTKMNSVTVNKEKFNRVLRRIPELEKYLDPLYAGKLALPEDSKLNILLAQEELIHKIAQDLEQLEKLRGILDSEHMNITPSMAKKFEELSEKHMKQESNTAELAEETKQLLQNYHTLITLLSKQFVAWDETLTKAEIAANPKKTLD